jgi:hypothetical protein
VVPGHVKLTFTLDMPRELAERLSARAIREHVNLEAGAWWTCCAECKRRFTFFVSLGLHGHVVAPLVTPTRVLETHNDPVTSMPSSGEINTS